MSTAAEIDRRRRDIVRRAGRAATAAEVFAVVSPELRRLVPFDAAGWLAADPVTGLPTSPVRIDDLDGITQAMCTTHWQRELLVDDVNLFRHLAHRDRPAGALRRSVDDPRRSPRYRGFMQPLGFDDELRAVLRVGDAPWGSVTLWRREGTSNFTRQETAILADLSAPLGEALRRHARPTLPDGDPPEHDRPGLLLFDADGELMSANDEARGWLDQLPPEPSVPTDGFVLPLWMVITMYRASAVHHGVGDGTARTRVRTRHGRWLVCHASCLHHPDDSAGPVALVIEPAQPAAIAPIVVQAYDLTDREQQIVQLIARGASTSEIADTLYLSPHTVRDHVKAIFAKVEVSSRGELTAKLFAEFYEPAHAANIVRTVGPDLTEALLRRAR